MQRRTLGYALSAPARLCEAWNIPPTDSRAVDIVNLVSERLLHKGKYWGTYGCYTVALSSNFLTLPPEIDTIEKVAQSNVPLRVRGLWYEFNGNGAGTLTPPAGQPLQYYSGGECIYRGNYPVIADITTPGILTVKCDVAADVGAKVLILGLDTNKNWIRTQVGGVWQDGELVALAQGAGTNTVNQFSQVTGVQPPAGMSGQWWLYIGGVTGTLLGQYQYWDASPSWKRYLLPFLPGQTPSVELIGKKAFHPVANPTDYLVVDNIGALRLGGLALIAEEQHQWVEANLLWNGGKNKDGSMVLGAVQLLEEQLQHHTGDGEVPSFEVKGSNIGQTEIVPTLI